jgi:diaminohydroxyphosphoribosylaminopyrimidine deaminase / 5-amino-6-(5-phosphoribosylamino)uracil reductase
MSRKNVSNADRRWMSVAIEQARLCSPSGSAYSVGAVIVDHRGKEISRGYSRETGPHDHAEESALAKLPPGDPRLPGGTVFSTLEPCSRRKSRERTCTQLILGAGVSRVVIAWLEPRLFVDDPQGREMLEAAGVTVTEMPEFAALAREPNKHLAV